MFFKVAIEKEERPNAIKYNYPEYEGETRHKNLGSNLDKDFCIWEAGDDISNGDTITELTETEKDDLLATWQAEKDAAAPTEDETE